ncbi:MAG: DNA alkylation repair protein [Epsilonproteobacteria bacterium]|nr:MAG: DNA alkylation repair protein [Campylobacterota bacterium]
MEPLKNKYNQNYIDNLSSDIKKIYKDFDTKNFKKDIFDKNWKNTELKNRMRRISVTIGVYLPQDYKKAIDILKNVYKQTDQTKGLENMIFQDFVEVYGLNYFDISMRALELFTINSSSEFAIRQFILKYPTKTMYQMLLWTKSDIVDIRRLSSEGCRPRLPWAIALNSFKQDPTRVFEILEILKHDTERYVLRSVANNLNDISKDNPNMVLNFIRQNININSNIDYVLKHGSRTMLKNGDKTALGLFGYKPIKAEIKNFKCDSIVKIGERLNFGFDIAGIKVLGDIRIEYIITYKLKNNAQGDKIYMISQKNHKAENLHIDTSHNFKRISTKVYNAGVHMLTININGEEKISKEFVLR